MEILVRQLGNGNAFAPELINTSFTLFDDTILVDCGYNVFQYLKCIDKNNILDKLQHVFITHIHDDHIGSLMSLVYYNEFVRRKRLEIRLPADVYEFLKPLIEKGIQEYPTGDVKRFKYNRFHKIILKIKTETIDVKQYQAISVKNITRKNHGNFYNTSYIFHYFNESKMKDYIIVISGDMQADKKLEEELNETIHAIHRDNIKVLVFHDYSKISYPGYIHANDYDINHIYSEEFRGKIIRVHTGETEDSKRRDLTIYYEDKVYKD